MFDFKFRVVWVKFDKSTPTTRSWNVPYPVGLRGGKTGDKDGQTPVTPEHLNRNRKPSLPPSYVGKRQVSLFLTGAIRYKTTQGTYPETRF